MVLDYLPGLHKVNLPCAFLPDCSISAVRGVGRLRALLHGFSPLRISMGPRIRITAGSSIVFQGTAAFEHGVSMTARGGQIIFGSNFHSNENVIYNADIGGKLLFGNNCLIGPRCIFRTANHKFSNVELDIVNQGHEIADISIGEDVWLGAGVIVLPGVKIGSHSVIGAGSVVSRDIPEYAVAVGAPATVIRLRK